MGGSENEYALYEQVNVNNYEQVNVNNYEQVNVNNCEGPLNDGDFYLRLASCRMFSMLDASGGNITLSTT